MFIKNYLKLALGICSFLCFGSLSAFALSIEASLPDGAINVTAVNDNILRVTCTRFGQEVAKSKAVVNPGGTTQVSNYENGNTKVLTTQAGVTVSLNTVSGALTINGGPDKTITSEGLPQWINGRQTLKLYTTSPGSFYGGGERGHSLNLRGDTLVMYNRQNYGYGKGDPRINQMNITMPLFVSSDGFALLFQDYASSEVVLGKNSLIEYSTENPNSIVYYYIYGKSTIADVEQQVSSLTGRQPLPPFWSLGYITSKYGYRTQDETLGAIDTLKTKGYPVDGIVLDLYWYGKEEDMGRLDWDKDQWPNPEEMLAQLKKDNVNLVAISQPYVLRNGRGVDNYNFLAENGMLVADSTGQNPQEVKIWVGEGGMLDVSNPKTRKWLADTYKRLTDMGVTGWWGDLGEPEVHPESGLHANGLSARQYHNQYGNDWSEIIFDMFKEEYPDTRLLTMMRGGTIGLQRYSVFPWSTDVSRSWAGLQPQVTIMLNSGLSGLGYMGHDVGGFAIDPANPVDPELYVRWLQLGLFSPMLRTHAQDKAEPYHYPEYESIILPLIKQRYEWLPYNYTLAYENATLGYPLVRPLNFYEKATTAYDSIDDEYLWGSELLVAPVMQKGATKRTVQFPQGTWVDYSNPTQRFEGGSKIEYDAPLQVLPLFVKAGAFIPLATYPMKSTADYNPAKLTVKYFPGEKSEYTLYDDNRMSASSLENGQYRLITFAGDANESQIAISISAKGTYEGAPSSINISMDVCGLQTLPKSIAVNGKKVKGKLSDNILSFPVKFNPTDKTNIIITL